MKESANDMKQVVEGASRLARANTDTDSDTATEEGSGRYRRAKSACTPQLEPAQGSSSVACAKP